MLGLLTCDAAFAMHKNAVPIPPPELVLMSNAHVPRIAAFSLTTGYGLAMGVYTGTVMVPIILGQRHQQTGMSAAGALLGATLGGAV